LNATEWKKRLRGASCAVVGLGVSNRPLIDFLIDLGARVSAYDQKERAVLGSFAEELDKKGVSLFTGEECLERLEGDIIFRSPGFRPDLPAFVRAVENGAILTSETELFLDMTPARVIGITGSDGKTTTTTLTYLLLKEEAKRCGEFSVFVGGNIGDPLLPQMAQMKEGDVAVAELSSFQLQSFKKSPSIAAITNLSPNHLNWHIDMEEYIDAKTNIYRYFPNTKLVLNAENSESVRLGKSIAAEKAITWFSSARHSASDFEERLRKGDRAIYVSNGWITLYDGKQERPLLRVASILLPGVHNLENYMTALALTEDTVSPESAEAVASSFQGVKHRLERVRVFEGVTYYNSSIDSTPSRTAAALSALKEAPIVICGGYDKHVPFEPLAEALCSRAKAVVLTGMTAEKIREALQAKERVQKGELPIYHESEFADAVNRARKIAREGDTVLLSPACASFDAFPNFEVRGETFCRIVNRFE